MSGIVALTGGTGFIGKVLWQSLEKSGWTVRALIRPSSLERNPEAFHGKEYVTGTLEDEKSLHALVEGVQAVVHCAGKVQGLDPTQFHQVNVEGVARVIRIAAMQNPLPRFVLLSSLAAREPNLSAYAWSKKQGELVLQEKAAEMKWIIFRPPAVYGPEDRAILPLFQWIQRGVGLQLGTSDARFSLLYVEDLASAVITWLEKDIHAGQAFELHDGHPGGYSWKDVFELTAKKKVIPLRIPGPFLYLIASVNQMFARVLRYEPLLTYGKVQELRHQNWVCDNTALSGFLGWHPAVSLPEGVGRTLAGDRVSGCS